MNFIKISNQLQLGVFSPYPNFLLHFQIIDTWNEIVFKPNTTIGNKAGEFVHLKRLYRDSGFVVDMEYMKFTGEIVKERIDYYNFHGWYNIDFQSEKRTYAVSIMKEIALLEDVEERKKRIQEVPIYYLYRMKVSNDKSKYTLDKNTGFSMRFREASVQCFVQTNISMMDTFVQDDDDKIRKIPYSISKFVDKEYEDAYPYKVDYNSGEVLDDSMLEPVEGGISIIP